MVRLRIEAADLTSEDAGGVKIIPEGEVEATMVRVGLLMRGDKVVVQVEGKDVASAPTSALAQADEDDKKQMNQFNRDLVTSLSSFSGAKRRTVLLEHEKKVPHGFVVAVQDASKTARMERVLFLLPPKKAS